MLKAPQNRSPASLGPQIGRRALVAGLLLPAMAARPAGASRVPVIVMLGDSVTAGYGLAAADSLPIQLQAALSRLGHPAKVRAAGVSGDTTADGLARVDFSVPAGTDLCVVELGGNDLLQGVDPALVRNNLTQIAARLKARRIPMLLVGIQAPPSIGAAYARDFNAAFAEAAKTAKVLLYPDWFKGVAEASLRQGDGVHPNPRGVKVIAASLAPFVVKALK